MPEYDSSKDKYLQSLVTTMKTRKIMMPSTKMRKVRIPSPKNISKSDSTKRLKQARPQAMRIQIINKLKSTIESAYIEKNLPVEYSKVYFESLECLDPRILMKNMSKTLNEIYSDKSTLQYAIKAIKAREN